MTAPVLTKEHVAAARSSRGPLWGGPLGGDWSVTIKMLCDSHEALRAERDAAHGGMSWIAWDTKGFPPPPDAPLDEVVRAAICEHKRVMAERDAALARAAVLAEEVKASRDAYVPAHGSTSIPRADYLLILARQRTNDSGALS